MAGFLTTHVLDTARGSPAAGLRVELRRLEGEAWVHLRTTVTNADGRTDGPILPASEFRPGTYELAFGAGDYLRGTGAALTDPPFLDVVPVRFGMERGHYHVPLLLSPYAYSTYRGS